MAAVARSEIVGRQLPRILHELSFTLMQVYLLLVLWWLAPAPPRANRRG